MQESASLWARTLCFCLLLGDVGLKGADDAIHHDADAPESTQLAARELQRLILRATGREFSVSSTSSPNPAVRLVSDESLPRDGFLIRMEDGAFVIAGNDTTPPEMWGTPSHGTLWGVCEFSERVLDVRWLFPGPLGEDIPDGQELHCALNEPIQGQPGFAVRALAYLGESERESPTRYQPVLDWMKHQRLTNALDPSVTGYGHSWDDYITPADMEAHPEWKSSKGAAARNQKVQFFCTTAPGLVELFAKRVIESLDRYPRRGMASISPTDGGGLCACDRCVPLIDTDPYGKPNHARAILTFYQQVAEIVARERPGRRLGGFGYYNYQYPPQSPPALPDNISICWAPLNYYGYGLLKPVYRAEFDAMMERWSAVTPHLFYHNYSTWMRSFHGAPLPVSLDILHRELPAAAAQRVWGARMVGTSAWGVNAPVNYLLAKQLWNPQLDLSATLNDWLARAYGPGWRHMRALYNTLDQRMRAHKEAQAPAYKGSQYEVNEDVMKAVYAPLFPSLERYYLSTLAGCVTDAQRNRLQMFSDNLVQLHHALRKAGLIDEASPSFFRRDDDAFALFMDGMKQTFSLFEDSQGQDHGPIWKGEWSAPARGQPK